MRSSSIEGLSSRRTAMYPELASALEAYRFRRHFDPTRYIEAKSALINAYFKQNGLQGCVVGLSGGVDSAITLGILAHASRQGGSPIRRIIALLLPMHGEGATNQDIASERATEVARKFDIECVTIDLSTTRDSATEASRSGTGIQGSSWATGQLVSYLRTPMLYYQSALLTEQGFRAVVCGTTNRDEGSYIGFFGKASDGMVDIQPISDVHKSEVYQVAKELDVPMSVRDAVPTGDTYDGACDEEMIGAPYDALELYTWYLCANVGERDIWLGSLGLEARQQFISWTEKFERLHRINSHKYIGDSPAVHLDIHERAVRGGWRVQDLELEIEHPESPSQLKGRALASRVGPVELDSQIETALLDHTVATVAKPIADFGDSGLIISSILNAETCDKFLHDKSKWEWIPADRHGRVIDHDSKQSVEIGSYRATAYDEDIAKGLWGRIAPFLPSVRTMGDFTPSDWNGHPVWLPVGINPMLRFIRYEKGGALVPHYDAGFDIKDGKRHTLMSMVITLTSMTEVLGKEVGGKTRFLLDHQRFLPLSERNYEDHPDLGRSRDVIFEVNASQGDALIFDHRILHDGSVWNGTEPRIILRTDIIFERCAPHVINVLQPTKSQLPSEKWARDPFFRKSYKLLQDQPEIEEAGYFDDGLQDDPDLDPKLWSAPFNKILNSLSLPKAQDPSRELVVLVSTGAFCPIHAGHLEMMEKAKSALEERGHVVLGGYLAPDHDAYVSSKCGNDTLSAPHRLDLCERAVEDSDWLMVERWAALHARTAVNFTTVVERLQKYLAYHIRTHRPIQVAFVFGSDNARFAKAFVGRGSCVCVSRPGHEAELERIAGNPLINGNRKILFCREKTQPLSSSLVRTGNIQELPEKVKIEWTRLQAMRGPSEIPQKRLMNLYLRDEGDWAVEDWTNLPKVNKGGLSLAFKGFVRGLVKSLELSFSGPNIEGGLEVQVAVLDLQKQKLVLDKLAELNSVISLDPCLQGAENVAVSRLFEPLSPTSLGFVPRPGADQLSTQVERLQNNSYVLFDDDTFSGATSKYIQRLISESKSSQAKISHFVALCDADGPATTSDVCGLNRGEQREPKIPECPPRLNHVDGRDFLVGAREAGLVVKLPDGTLCRAPYVLPYVRPHYHVSIHVNAELEFSKTIWQLNKTFFEVVGNGELKIKDCGAAAWRLFDALGFDAQMTMVELCEWHIRKLG